ncbi:MAG: glycosyltransferase [Candidatus Limnocylindrales bacterium]
MSPDTSPVSGRGPGPGILLYGMYDLRSLDRAPEVRIAMMTGALSRRVHTERIVGGRLGRTVAAFRWLASGGSRRVGAVYVEAPTSAALPGDLAFLALMRLLGRPVGVYFRDAYQLFRDLYPRQHRRQVIVDRVWRVTTWFLKRIATVRYAPSSGLARVLGLRDAVLLPPGTDPTLPDLGIGEPDLVAAIVQVGPRSGLEALIEAVALVRANRPPVRLRIVARSADGKPVAGLPDWVEVASAGRDSLAEALRPARVCVLPLPVTAYADLAVAVRLVDLLAFGKPIVATDAVESRALIEASGAGIVTPDTPEGQAGGILRLLEDDALAARSAAAARAYAVAPDHTWDARARTVLDTLGLAAES